MKDVLQKAETNCFLAILKYTACINTWDTQAKIIFCVYLATYQIENLAVDR
jgi:hypothetical protein